MMVSPGRRPSLQHFFRMADLEMPFRVRRMRRPDFGWDTERPESMSDIFDQRPLPLRRRREQKKLLQAAREDQRFNTKESSVKLAYEGQPRPKALASLVGETIVKVACGTNHTVSVDSNGFVYTWGFGGCGRLGHREQKDEWLPRRVDVFTRHNVLPPNAVISAGSVNSSCTAGGAK